MNQVMIALGMVSIMLCTGMFLRGKISFLQKMLVPVSVIAGVIGFIVMNFIMPILPVEVEASTFSDIVDVLFTLSFISIGLASGGGKKSKKKEESETKSSGPVQGALGMGLIWCILYALTAVVGVAVIALTGSPVGMDSMYGMLIPFAFCQGPGQASTYGRIFENTYGFENAEMVALTFAVVGFLAAFVIGVPLAKYGMKRNLAKNPSKINRAVEKGYYTPEEQRESMGKVTTHSGNIETLTVHFAMMGIAYLLALGMAKLISFVPVLGPTFSGMLFFWGMLGAYLVKGFLGKMKIAYIINNPLQGRITGFTSDFLVVSAFMAVHLTVIGNWLIPILIECAIVAVLTIAVCIFFGSRLGSDHDFERVLGLYGTCTGTTPSGVALLRMVDPRLTTTTASELGMMNMAMLFSTPTMIFITLGGQGTIPMVVALAGMLLTVLFYLVMLKVFRVYRKPSFSLRRGKLGADEDDVSKNVMLVQGFLREEKYDSAGMIL